MSNLLSLLLSGIAAVSSSFGVAILIINWYRSLPRAKIIGIWRDPSSNVIPRGEGESDNQGNHALTVLVEVTSNTSTVLTDCSVQYKTDLGNDHFLDWSSYRQHIARGKKDTFGAGAFNSFTLRPYCSKILRAAIKASTKEQPIIITFAFGNKIVEKTLRKITSLDFFPRLPPF